MSRERLVLLLAGGIAAGCSGILGVHDRKLRAEGAGGETTTEAGASAGGDTTSSDASMVDGEGGSVSSGGSGGAGGGSGANAGSGGMPPGAGGAPLCPPPTDPCGLCVCSKCASAWSECFPMGNCGDAIACAANTCSACPAICTTPELQGPIAQLKACFADSMGAGCASICGGKGGAGGMPGAGGFGGVGGMGGFGGAVTGSEICDYRDNDGNGIVDDGLPWAIQNQGSTPINGLSTNGSQSSGASSPNGAVFAGVSTNPPTVWIAGFSPGSPTPNTGTFTLPEPPLRAQVAAIPGKVGQFYVVVATGDPTACASGTACSYYFGVTDVSVPAPVFQKIPPTGTAGAYYGVLGLLALGDQFTIAAMAAGVSGLVFPAGTPASVQPAPSFDGTQLGPMGTFAPADPTGGTAVWVGPNVPTGPGTVYTVFFQGGKPMGSAAGVARCTDSATRVVASVLGGTTLAAAWSCGTQGTTLGTAPPTGAALTLVQTVDPGNSPFGMVSVDVGGALVVGGVGTARVFRLQKNSTVDGSVTPLDVQLQGGSIQGVQRRAVAFDGKGLILLTTVGVSGSISYVRVGCL